MRSKIVMILFFFMFSKIYSQAPQWTISNWYRYSINSNVESSINGTTTTLSINSTSTTFTVSEEGMRTQEKGNMESYYVYVVEYEGDINASGHVTITDPFNFDTDIRMRNGTQSGYYWVEKSTLRIVKRYTSITGQLEANLFGEWTVLGTMTMTTVMEYHPPMYEVKFPPEMGQQWQQNMKIYLFGSFIGDFEIYGYPYQVNEEFDMNKNFSFNSSVNKIELINGCSSYKVVHNDSPSQSKEIFWYCLESLWFSRLKMNNFLFSNSNGDYINTVNWTANLIDYEVTYPVTPTPTFTPTSANTKTPTPTPTFSPTPPHNHTPVPSPSITPTPPEFILELELEIPQNYFCENDTFYLKAYVTNYRQSIIRAAQWLVLDVYGEYWCLVGENEIESCYRLKNFPPGLYEEMLISPFTWPHVESSLNNIKIHCALTDPAIINIYDYKFVQFSYGPCQ